MKRAVGAKTKAHAPQSALEAVSKALGVEIGDQATATLALTHRSFETEQRVEGLATLRLLGMPVLNLCLTRLVLEELDDMDEVDNKQRAAKLSTVAELADVMQECQLMQHVRVGGGLEQLRLAGSLPATALAEVLLNLLEHLQVKATPHVMYCGHDPGDLELGIEPLLDHLNRREKHTQAIQGQVFRLYRDEELTSGHEHVHREHGHSWRSVYEDVVIIRTDLLHGLLEYELTSEHVLDLELGPFKVNARRDEVICPFRRFMPQDGLREPGLSPHNVIDRELELIRTLPQGDCQACLRIHVNQEHSLPVPCKSRSKVNDTCGLANAAFLIDYGHDPSRSHVHPSSACIRDTDPLAWPS